METITYVLRGEVACRQPRQPRRDRPPATCSGCPPAAATWVRAGAARVRFLLISGKPIREPTAWRGPIVMNTEAELEFAFDELERGTSSSRHHDQPPAAWRV